MSLTSSRVPMPKTSPVPTACPKAWLRRARASLCALLALAGAAVAVPAAAIEVVVGGGVERSLPLAVVDFGGVGNVELATVIRNDLRRSGYFYITDPADMPAHPTSPTQVDYTDWRRLGVESLLVGEVLQGADGYRLHYYLLDVYGQRQIIAERIDSGNLRLAAHRISDSVFAALSGRKGGMFQGKMVFVSDGGTVDQPSYFLSMSDYDGYGARVLLDSPEPILSPAFSPDGSSLAYVVFERGSTTIYVQDIASGRRQRVSAWPGINGSPAYSPDGSSIAASLSRDGNPEIYLLHLASATWQRITNSSAIDTEPAWTPDGKSLVFTSDRSGKPQVYKVELATGATRRLTFSGEYNAGPAISPDGSAMAVITADGNNFMLALLDPDSGEVVRAIRTVVPPEKVGFAANGQLLLYSSGDRIGTVPVTGSPDIPITMPEAIRPRQASWGTR